MIRSDIRRRSVTPPVAADLGVHDAFSNCQDADIIQLVQAGTEVPIPATWAFIQQGTPADTAYLLLHGRARVFSGRHQVATVEAGDLIGEMALIEGRLRQATVASTGTLRVLRLDYDRLAALLPRTTPGTDRPRSRLAGRSHQAPTAVLDKRGLLMAVPSVG
jgi:CRP/FNR family transcriptional regulator, cyclic AMP receptor protein